MFKFFIENELISSNQSDFKLGGSCVNQLVSIKHEIYKSFDGGHEVSGVFLDISKAFDKVWHDGIILKLTQNGISGNLLKLLRDFLSEITTRSSEWSSFHMDKYRYWNTSRFHSWSINGFNLCK